MKKTLAMTIVLTILLSLFTVVNAATSTTPSATAVKSEDGKTVTVTLSFTEGVKSGDFKLLYNDKQLTYVEKSIEPSALTKTTPVEGGLRFAWVNDATTKTVTLKFNVVEGAEGDATIEFVPATLGDENNDEIASSEAKVTATVALTEKPVEPGTDPEKPGTDSEKPGTSTENPGQTTPTKPGDEVSTDETKPGKDKQTGVNVLAVVLPTVALLTLAGVVISKKN